MLLGAKGTYGGDADQPEVLLEAKGTYGGGATGEGSAMAVYEVRLRTSTGFKEDKSLLRVVLSTSLIHTPSYRHLRDDRSLYALSTLSLYALYSAATIVELVSSAPTRLSS